MRPKTAPRFVDRLGEGTAMYRGNYVTRGLVRACPIFCDPRIALPLHQPEGRTRRFRRVGPAPISGERRGPLETAGRLETTREAAENRSPNNRPRKEREATAIPKVMQCKDHSDKRRKKKKGNQSVDYFVFVHQGEERFLYYSLVGCMLTTLWSSTEQEKQVTSRFHFPWSRNLNLRSSETGLASLHYDSCGLLSELRLNYVGTFGEIK